MAWLSQGLVTPIPLDIVASRHTPDSYHSLTTAKLMQVTGDVRKGKRLLATPPSRPCNGPWSVGSGLSVGDRVEDDTLRALGGRLLWTRQGHAYPSPTPRCLSVHARNAIRTGVHHTSPRITLPKLGERGALPPEVFEDQERAKLCMPKIYFPNCDRPDLDRKADTVSAPAIAVALDCRSKHTRDPVYGQRLSSVDAFREFGD